MKTSIYFISDIPENPDGQSNNAEFVLSKEIVISTNHKKL